MTIFYSSNTDIMPVHFAVDVEVASSLQMNLAGKSSFPMFPRQIRIIQPHLLVSEPGPTEVCTVSYVKA